jgi:hypothetical protein
MRNKKIASCFVAIVLGLFFAARPSGIGAVAPMLGANEIEGGGSFENAVLIGANNYQVAKLPEDTSQFFYFVAKPGQEINISTKFAKATDDNYDTSVGMKLYDLDQQELRNEYGWTGDTVKFSWFSDLGAAGKKYYVEVYNEGPYDASSFAMTVATADYYDAASQTDAGQDINGAISVKFGQHKGYLTGGDAVDNQGTDFADFYKFSVKSGENVNIKATPSPAAQLSLTIYDAQRKAVSEVSADNPGQIINLPYAAPKGGEVYLEVACYNGYCGSKLASYSLSIGAVPGGGIVPPGGGDGESGDGGGGTGAGDVLPPGDYPELPPGGGPGPGDVLPPGRDGFYPELFPDYPETGFPGAGGFSMALIWANVAILIIMLLGGLIFYIYFGICLQKLAKRTGTTPAWLAWIPIGNIFLMLKIAQKPLWWFLLLFIPIVNIVIGVIVWMKIAENVGKEAWVALLMFVPVVGIAMPAYLAFSGSSQKKTELANEGKKPEFIGGSKEADKPVVGYKHPCKYCGEMVSPDAAICPLCGKEGPLGPDRCPKCHDPIEKKWKVCSHCGLNLRIVCPFCGKVTFFGNYCEDCGKKLMVNCPYCQFEQPPVSDKCIKCGKPLEKPADKK